MELKSVDLIKSPLNPHAIRLVGEVSYNKLPIKSELCWFELDEKYAPFISKSGNPWLLCLLPLATTLGEPLKISLPVDPVLLKNVSEILRIWKCWNSQFNLIPIEAHVKEKMLSGTQQFRKTAAFFSGGIDSFFTVLRHADASEAEFKINHLLTVWGFDIPLINVSEFSRHKSNLANIATKLNKELNVITTNLRQTSFKLADWGVLSYGCGLASIAYILEELYSNVLIASAGGYCDMRPRGVHVVTVPLFSSNSLHFFQDGSTFSRFQKTEFLINSPLVQEYLHVCYKNGGTDTNCGKCIKCFRTMLTLDVLGVLDKFNTFPRDNYNKANFSRVFLKNDLESYYFNKILMEARKKNRNDIEKNILRALKHTRQIKIYLSCLKSLNILLWRLPSKDKIIKLLERLILRKAIY